jgi:hypothetical protein
MVALRTLERSNGSCWSWKVSVRSGQWARNVLVPIPGVDRDVRSHSGCTSIDVIRARAREAGHFSSTCIANCSPSD